MSTTNLTGTNSAIGKYGHIAAFAFGFYMLPAPARKFYIGAAGSIIGGFFALGKHPVDPYAAQPAWWTEFYITPLTVIFWVVAAVCIWAMVHMARWARRQEPSEDAPAPQALAVQPQPAAPATVHVAAVAAPVSKHVDATTTESGLFIPSYTHRRVRRGGETLSGTPIKDRRSVDPRTL